MRKWKNSERIDLVNLLLRTKIIECSEQDIELDVFVSTQIDKDMKRLDVSDGGKACWVYKLLGFRRVRFS